MSSRTTKTGNFTIGLRRAGGWQSDLDALIKWAVENGFGAIDLGGNCGPDLAKVLGAGLRTGSVDLLGGDNWTKLASPDAGKRTEAAAATSKWIEEAGKSGPKNFFLVVLPEDPARSRKENFDFAVDGYSKLVPSLEKTGSHLVIEGWPGPGALCCTPETVRAFFKAIPSDSMGLNYDPSHLIRMGVDHLRFLNEFASRVHHVHGKDTEILVDRIYEFGHEQPGAFEKGAAWGAWAWRYTIPGKGVANWPEIFRVLNNAGYKGCVSVELEDLNYNGSEAGEKKGFVESLEFLAAQ